MPEDMSFNKHVDVAPPPNPQKSSKGLIIGVLIVLAGLGAAAYGYHAGIFKMDPKGADTYTFKGDC